MKQKRLIAIISTILFLGLTASGAVMASPNSGLLMTEAKQQMTIASPSSKPVTQLTANSEAPLLQLRSQLKLTDTQTQEIKNIYTRVMVLMVQYQAQLSTAKTQLQELTNGKEASLQQISALAQRQGDAAAKIIVLQVLTKQEIHKVLTPEQVTTLRQLEKQTQPQNTASTTVAPPIK